MENQKKYYTLYKTIKSKILSGEYKQGEKLPSKRVMADLSSVSTITVESAYNRLADEGYIFSKERSGYFVSEIDAVQTEEYTKGRELDFLDEEYLVPSGDFEYSVWFKTVRKVLSEKGEKLFVKSPNKGCSVLRNAIAQYLYRYRGMYAQPRQIIVGSGSEQLYDSIVRILGRDKIYAIEDPSYAQIETVYSGMGIEIEKLKMGKSGIESEALEKSRADILHVTPFHSYPTGVTASAKKRYEYLKWVEAGNRYIVEDDFDSEFFIPGHPIESLYSLDNNGFIIYINTFSKSLSPSMRMGYMVLPEKLLDVYDEKMGVYSCTVPVLDQYVLAEFISSGNFERHLNRTRRKMKSGENK
ncbi:MAG: PLP-dependent aminotransferase family protein [Ruminococcaceae bacterium]|nr:PLP-dependent aminotransferase family protein [Oscillospiraceae bacterium]